MDLQGSSSDADRSGDSTSADCDNTGQGDSAGLGADPAVSKYAETAAAKCAEEKNPCPFSDAELAFVRMADEFKLPRTAWGAILKWHNSHSGSYLRQDPRTYTKAITERHCAEDTHQHVAAYEHSSPLALMRITNVAFTDPLWVIQVQAALLAGLKSGILMQKSAFVFKIPLFAFLNPHLTGHSDGY